MHSFKWLLSLLLNLVCNSFSYSLSTNFNSNDSCKNIFDIVLISIINAEQKDWNFALKYSQKG